MGISKQLQWHSRSADTYAGWVVGGGKEEAKDKLPKLKLLLVQVLFNATEKQALRSGINYCFKL